MRWLPGGAGGTMVPSRTPPRRETMMIQQLYVLLAALGTLLLLAPIALWPVLEEELTRGE